MKRENKEIDMLIIDGYVDEPSLLGVPPYISPKPREIAGVAESWGLNWDYITADQYRKLGMPSARIVAVHGGVTVPGKYLSGTPLSRREAAEIANNSEGETFLGGPLARYGNVKGYHHYSRKDLGAYIHTFLEGKCDDRRASAEETEKWLIKGASVVQKHPLYPKGLMVEIITYRGCVRYFTGGCSFCSEPSFGKPVFRTRRHIVNEVKALYEMGVRNFRLGGQTCIFSCWASETGINETPRPNVEEISGLFEDISRKCPDIEVLHVDNANPAIIAAHPREATAIIKTLARYCTPGNILALGMESADERVIEQNNLNANPEQVEKAVELINRYGKEMGHNGMPIILPGINFLGGLNGETPDTHKINFQFLEKLKQNGHWLRRINIRQVLSFDGRKNSKPGKYFRKFKERVNKEINRPLLKEIWPRGTILRNVYMEKHRGKMTFGRQIGTYPLLVGVEYPLELGKFYDIMVTNHGYRSITGVRYPVDIERTSYRELSAIPGIGKKRAAKIFINQPGSAEEIEKIIGTPREAKIPLKYFGFS